MVSSGAYFDVMSGVALNMPVIVKLKLDFFFKFSKGLFVYSNRLYNLDYFWRII
jgi:hypothetical protein